MLEASPSNLINNKNILDVVLFTKINDIYTNI